MKSKISENSFLLLVFLALFGFSVGLFSNYRELWMSNNNISASSISHVVSISYVVTVLVLTFFTIRVRINKIKNALEIVLVLKMITSSLLIVLNNSDCLILIKFLMFFDIAFNELILASIYPIMLNLDKSDVLYTKKETVEFIFNRLGFLLSSLLIGKVISNTIIDYNSCLLGSVFFTFISFIIFLNIDILNNKSEEQFNLNLVFKYFKNNKAYNKFLFVNFISSITWGIILGMPLLTLTINLSLDAKLSSFIVLGMGILSSLAALFIVKYLNFKNDYLNIFIKFGFRIILFILILLFNNKLLFLGAILYLLLTDKTHNFIFHSFFINRVEEKYSLLLHVLKYCTSLMGNAIGIFIYGLIVNLDFRLFIIPILIFSLIHYGFALDLIKNKHLVLKEG